MFPDRSALVFILRFIRFGIVTFLLPADMKKSRTAPIEREGRKARLEMRKRFDSLLDTMWRGSIPVFNARRTGASLGQMTTVSPENG